MKLSWTPKKLSDGLVRTELHFWGLKGLYEATLLAKNTHNYGCFVRLLKK